MPKILIPYDEQQILMGGEKLRDKSQDDQAKHLRSYTTSFKEANWKKMIKSKMSNKNKTNDVNVVCKGRSYLVYNQN